MTQSPESVRKVIDKTFDALKKYMHPDPIIDCKTGFNLLSVTDRLNLMGKDIRDKNHTILKKVISRGVNGYTDFKERLKKTLQTELLELIQCAENGQDTKEIEDQLEKNVVLSAEYIKLKMGIEMRYNPKSVMQNSKTMEMTLSTEFVKYGMKSNLTSGTYQCSGGSVRLDLKNQSRQRPRLFRYLLADQIEIRDKTGKFCKPGDSGAMVFIIDKKNKELMALGILTGRIGKITYVTPIWNILKEIGMPLPYVLAEPI